MTDNLLDKPAPSASRRAHLNALRRHLVERAAETAFECEGERWSFGDLASHAQRYAVSLRAAGVKPGDRVACLLDSSLEMIAVLLGHYMGGVVHVPINTRYGHREVAHILEDCGASALVYDAHLSVREMLSQMSPSIVPPRLVVRGAAALQGEASLKTLLEARGDEVGAPDWAWAQSDEDPALMIYTSGTTGLSKGVVLPYRAIVANIDALTRLWRWTQDDHLILALPLFHVHGLCIGIHGVLLRGCRATIQPRFEARRVIEAVAAGGSIFMGVPTMYARLVKALDASPELSQGLRRARLFTSGSAALSADLFEAFERHTGHRILERYGMSETLLTLSNPYEPALRKPGTIGFAVSSGEVRVVDEGGSPCAQGDIGEIAVRGESLMHGYWGRPDQTARSMRGGWFMTGDVARVDEQGYVVHVGRRSVDILKCGGYKISAREIEEAIARHPEVAEVAVVGLPDAEYGQRIAAAVVPSADAPERVAEDWRVSLSGFLTGALADFKHPRVVLLLDEVPRNALGKVQKHRIKAMVAS